jgi:ubiquinone biosynthesis accessory factor UbiK
LQTLFCSQLVRAVAILASTWSDQFYGGCLLNVIQRSTVPLTPFELSTNMLDPKPLEDLARRLAAAVPESAAQLKADLQKNFQSVLQSGLSKLDLVTRQEFEVQAGVLKRTREKLEQLEAKLAALEANARTN